MRVDDTVLVPSEVSAAFLDDALRRSAHAAVDELEHGNETPREVNVLAHDEVKARSSRLSADTSATTPRRGAFRLVTLAVDGWEDGLMFEQFTDGARRAVVLAQDEARRLNHSYIGTEHLLLGLLREGQGVAATALNVLGVSLDGVRQRVEETIGRGAENPAAHLPFTPPAKQAIARSLEEALRLKHRHIGTEHILLGLLHQDGDTAIQILVALGTDADRVLRQVHESLP